VQNWVSRGARIILAAVFLLAAVPKLFNPADFAQVISMYGIVPGGLTLETALVLIAAELVIAFGLLLDRFWAVAAAAVMLLLFIAVLAYGIHLGLDIDCGCFGPEDPEHGAVNNLRSAVVRDTLLLIPIAYLLFRAIRTTPKNYLYEEIDHEDNKNVN
jgi:uncharacterized membrane protein YphA (DoxX/SURF4 family)